MVNGQWSMVKGEKWKGKLLLLKIFLVQTFVFQLNIVVSLTCTFQQYGTKKNKGLIKRHLIGCVKEQLKTSVACNS